MLVLAPTASLGYLHRLADNWGLTFAQLMLLTTRGGLAEVTGVESAAFDTRGTCGAILLAGVAAGAWHRASLAHWRNRWLLFMLWLGLMAASFFVLIPIDVLTPRGQRPDLANIAWRALPLGLYAVGLAAGGPIGSVLGRLWARNGVVMRKRVRRNRRRRREGR